ncbi:MAG: signal recognition particle receptor subunit alpha [Planctomycetes bacterium]|nr:signal recognition particle receptor subunit alpha [Planctomycetota bacterium]
MGLFDKFRKGLSRTRERIASGFRAALRVGHKIDEATLGRLEETMLAADFGPATTIKLIDTVRGAWKAGSSARLSIS